MQVDYINHMGTDDTIVDAARVSFNKHSSNYTDTQNNNLIKYLRGHNHWSPFSHCIIQFRITAPIYVARQLFKHQVGFSINEVSRRYVDYEPTTEPPLIWREKPQKTKKQGSGKALNIENQKIVNKIVNKHIKKSTELYNQLLTIGVAPEQARTVLPLCTETQWIWTGTLEGWLRICKLRLTEDAQQETQYIVKEIANHVKTLFPKAWEASYESEDLHP